MRSLAGTLTAVLLAALYLWIDPHTADLAAQLFRTELYREHGFAIYNPQWYSGHHLPGYSLISPPLMAIAGPQAAGAAAAIVGTWAFERIAHRFKPDSLAAPIASSWFALGMFATGLVTGRITFAIGAAFALVAAALAGSQARPARSLAPLVAAAAGLASPVAGALLALGMAVWLTATRRRAVALAVIAGAVIPAGALLVAFPTGGSFPFVISSLLPTLGAMLILWLALPVYEVPLRRAVLAIGLLVFVSGVLSTPMGGNATRPATLLAGSIAVLGLWPHKRKRLLWLAPILLYGQLYPAFDDWNQSRGDGSTTAAYYAPLRAELARLSRGVPVRVEVPFTDNHWESFRLTDRAPNTLLARGWERQLDRKRNTLFYKGDSLTHEQYANWLREGAISYVALPDAPLDYSAAREADLIRERPGYLREVWRDEHWRLFEVTATLPLVDGGLMTRAEPDRLTVRVSEPGYVLVRSAYSPYFEVGDERPTDTGGWMLFCAPRPGTYVLRARLAVRLHGDDRAPSATCQLR